MTWSPGTAEDNRKGALRVLLTETPGGFVRKREWCIETGSAIPTPVWSRLHAEGLVQRSIFGSRPTLAGWVAAHDLHREELQVDRRFGILASHLKKSTSGRSETSTTVDRIAKATGLNPEWIYDAIDGRLAETIYGQYGAVLASKYGEVDIPPHIGNKLR